MRLIFTFAFLLNFLLSFAQQPVCTEVSGCNWGNNARTAASEFFVNTDSVINITDTSAIIKGYANSRDLNCSYRSTPLKVTALAFITTDCNVACNSNLAAGKVFTKSYDSTSCYFWINNEEEIVIRVNNLRPKTTYYVRFMIHRQFYGYPPRNFNYLTHDTNAYYIGNILKFKTANGYEELNNNYISAENPVYCPNNTNSGMPTYNLKGSDPGGAIGNYAYNWQMSSDGGATWSVASGNNNNPANTKNLNLTFGDFDFNWEKQVRRIVSSGYHSDTSNVINIKYYSTAPSVLVNVVQQPQLSKDILLVTQPGNYQGTYQVQWFDSINDRNPVPIPSLADGSLLLSVTTQTIHNYRAVITIGSGCPTYSSPAIGISNPDSSGNIYPAILIGAQYWFLSNLRTKKLTNGNPINLVTDNNQWKNATDAAYCWHNNDAQNSVPYGVLYNGHLLLKHSDKVCPVGWHVLTWHEWKTLTTFIGGPDGSGAGNILKTNSVWLPPNGGNNTVNFNALPGGRRNSNGNFAGKYTNGYWWFLNSSVMWGYVQLNNASPVLFENANNSVNVNPALLNNGCSIRCVK